MVALLQEYKPRMNREVAEIEIGSALYAINSRFCGYVERKQKIFERDLAADRVKRQRERMVTAMKRDMHPWIAAWAIKHAIERKDYLLPAWESKTEAATMRAIEDCDAIVEEGYSVSEVKDTGAIVEVLNKYNKFLLSFINDPCETKDKARDVAIIAADDCLPLLKKLLSVPHLLLSYPNEAYKRARTVAAEARVYAD
jgi:hypothetical protein